MRRSITGIGAETRADDAGYLFLRNPGLEHEDREGDDEDGVIWHGGSGGGAGFGGLRNRRSRVCGV